MNEVSVFGVWGVLIRCRVMTFDWPKWTFMRGSHGKINRYCQATRVRVCKFWPRSLETPHIDHSETKLHALLKPRE